jgi:hypothetical protein
LSTATSSALATLPLDGGFTRFDLGNAPNGGLSLFTSRPVPTAGGSHCTIVFNPSSQGLGTVSGFTAPGELGGRSCITGGGLVLGLLDPSQPGGLRLSGTPAGELSLTPGFDINQCL